LGPGERRPRRVLVTRTPYAEEFLEKLPDLPPFLETIDLALEILDQEARRLESA
jgi:hypothetical protein